MAHSYDSDRERHSSGDPFSQAGLRPYDYPNQTETGMGGLAAAAVLVAVFGLILLASAFGGDGEGVTSVASDVGAGQIPGQTAQ